jgi:hypothetical protein
VIDGRMESGASGTITYALTPRVEGTTFEHDFVYAMPSSLPAMLDRLLVFRRRIEPESAEALRRLKNVLERRVA